MAMVFINKTKFVLVTLISSTQKRGGGKTVKNCVDSHNLSLHLQNILKSRSTKFNYRFFYEYATSVIASVKCGSTSTKSL